MRRELVVLLGQGKELGARKTPQGAGDVWTWTAIDAETKLMVRGLWAIGQQNAAASFIDDVAGRLAYHMQLTTDGHRPYLRAAMDLR